MTDQTTSPIDIWEIAESLWRENEDRLGLPRSTGPLDPDIEQKISCFKSWDQIAAASLEAMQPVLAVERFLHDVYGVMNLQLKQEACKCPS